MPVWLWWWNQANIAWVTNKLWRPCVKAKRNWYWLPAIPQRWGETHINLECKTRITCWSHMESFETEKYAPTQVSHIYLHSFNLQWELWRATLRVMLHSTGKFAVQSYLAITRHPNGSSVVIQVMKFGSFISFWFLNDECIWNQTYCVDIQLLLETLSEMAKCFYAQTECTFSLLRNLFFFLSGNLRLNITLCWPRPKCNITVAPTSNWVPLAVNTSVCAQCPSPILEIRISSAHCQTTKSNDIIL